MDDFKLQSSTNGENKNRIKNIGNFLIAGTGLAITMGIVAVLVYYK